MTLPGRGMSRRIIGALVALGLFACARGMAQVAPQAAPSTAPADAGIRAMASAVAAQRGAIDARLAKIQGHESTKATILYPYDLARVVAEGIRGYNAADLGIEAAGT